MSCITTGKVWLLAIACLVVAMAPAAEAADAKEQEGVVVSAGMKKLVITDTEGKQHTHAADEMTKVTVHGKPAQLEALKLGMRVRVMLDEQNKLLAVSTVDEVKLALRPLADTAEAATPPVRRPIDARPPTLIKSLQD